MWDLPTYVVGDLSLYLKEAGSLKEIIFLTYLWVNLNILDWERNKSHSKQWVLVDWPSRFFLTYNWSCTSITYMPTEHHSVTHHLARSSDKVCFTDCCQSSQIYTTHTATKNTNWTKPNQTQRGKLRESEVFQLFIQCHLTQFGSPNLQFLATSQLYIFNFGKKSLMPLLLVGYIRLLLF